MCGIAGFVQSAPPLPPDADTIVRRMAQALRHRGPDGEGYFVQGPVAFGHRRLSIIDLEGGAQPLANEDGSVVIVFNGEIYNFQDLRRDLEAAGHRFATRSDTEVIVHAYEEYGPDCLDRFNGMFAFALWDARRKRLFAARDRMGKKPFHYAFRDGALIFASEIKALLHHPALRPRVSPRTLARYLGFGYVPAPDTIYEGIRKLPPAHRLLFENGDLKIEPYWRIDFERAGLDGLGEAELRRRFLDLFRDAVRLRLISDVPLGVFLSGGMDSSAVAAMMCRIVPPSSVETFSIAFREKDHDESAYARLVAERLGTNHHEKVLDEATMLERLPGLIAGMDEPFADASLSPTSLVSEFARTKVTVALGGDGGDELFAGYNTFHLDRLTAWYALLPRPLRRRIIEPTAALIGLLAGRARWRRGGRYVGDAADAPEAWRVMMWSEAVAKPALLRAVLAVPAGPETAPETVYRDTAELYSRAPRRSRLARAQYQYQHQYLPDDILAKVDRASMAHSLEARAPFLDWRVVDFANALPDRLKLRRGVGKVFLKDALRGILPEEVLRRPKKGFGIPMDEWLRSGLREHFERTCSEDRLREQGIFRPAPIRRLWAEHLSGRYHHGGVLWTFLAFQLWQERHAPAFAAEEGSA